MNDGQKEKNERGVGEMHKRREKMTDGRRYLIYYTFGSEKITADSNENSMPESEARNSAAEKSFNV